MTPYLRSLYRVLTDARALADTQDALTRSEVSNASLDDVVNDLRSALRLAELDLERARAIAVVLEHENAELAETITAHFIDKGFGA